MFESECECHYLFLDYNHCNDKYNVGNDNVDCYGLRLGFMIIIQ